MSIYKTAKMKQVLFLAVSCLLVCACNKDTKSDGIAHSLNGQWRLTLVKDNNAGTTLTKPVSLQKDVDITIIMKTATDGTFTGVTPTNQIAENNFYTDIKQAISIPVLSMTKVSETPWGDEFVSNIRDAKTYFFDASGLLNIVTTNKTLGFVKQ